MKLFFEKIYFLTKSIFNGVGGVEITYSLDLDQEKRLLALLKKMQFVETVKDGWIRKFTKVLITEESIFVGHHISDADFMGHKAEKMNLKLTKIENPLLTIKGWIKYFDRI